MAITLSVEDKKYKLGFTKRTIATLEQQGFNISEVSDKPALSIPMFWNASFLAYEPRVSNKIKDELWEHLEGKPQVIEALVNDYVKQIESLMDEPESSDPKKVVMVLE